MRRFITSVSVDTLTLEGVAELTGLDFLDPADLTDLPGPFVYVLADPHGAVFYPGKSEAAYKAARRTMAYAKWTAEVSEHVRQFGRPDPSEDPQTGDLSMVHWSPIVRSARRYSLLVKAAQVPDPETASARVWEARIQALIGTLTTIESLIGGSGWEANPGTLRGDAYAWAEKRISDFRKGL